MADLALIDRVISDSALFIEKFAEEGLHRDPEHVEKIIRPHVQRIADLLGSELAEYFLDRVNIFALEQNRIAAASILMIVDEIREKGVEGCLKVCRGLHDVTPSSSPSGMTP